MAVGNNDGKAVIDLVIRGCPVTKDILKAAMMDFLEGKTEKKGLLSYRQLNKQSGGKLDSIEVTENNIGDFLKTARKYDVNYALKKDKSTDPPTYHVMFETNKAENFKRAFAEYSETKATQIKRGEITGEKMKQIDSNVKAKQAEIDKQRSLEKDKEKSRGDMSL